MAARKCAACLYHLIGTALHYFAEYIQVHFLRETDDDLKVLDFVDTAYEGCRYVSGGVYCFNNKVINLLQEAVDEGVSRMRNFQRKIVYSGLKVQAHPFSKIIDVDHASDIQKAELFLNEMK
jgi:NDP-sugar pyrophosphorylase family protein